MVLADLLRSHLKKSIGGNFAKVGEQSVRVIAKWDGTQWIPLSNGVSLGSEPGRVKALAVNSDVNLYVGV